MLVFVPRWSHEGYYLGRAVLLKGCVIPGSPNDASCSLFESMRALCWLLEEMPGRALAAKANLFLD